MLNDSTEKRFSSSRRRHCSLHTREIIYTWNEICVVNSTSPSCIALTIRVEKLPPSLTRSTEYTIGLVTEPEMIMVDSRQAISQS